MFHTIVSRCGGECCGLYVRKVTRIRICELYTSRECVESATCQQHEVKGKTLVVKVLNRTKNTAEEYAKEIDGGAAGGTKSSRREIQQLR